VIGFNSLVINVGAVGGIALSDGGGTGGAHKGRFLLESATVDASATMSDVPGQQHMKQQSSELGGWVGEPSEEGSQEQEVVLEVTVRASEHPTTKE
jgi:hypothetical protein